MSEDYKKLLSWRGINPENECKKCDARLFTRPDTRVRIASLSTNGDDDMSNRIHINPITIAELHAQLQALVDAGHGAKPVVTTDCRANYPFQAHTVYNVSGYLDKLLIYARPDARFAERKYSLAEFNASPEKVEGWNEGADLIAARCGAFA